MLHCRLSAEEMKDLQKLAYGWGLTATAAAQILLKAGVAAILQNSGRMPLPLRFTVSEIEPARMETVKPGPARR